MRDDPMSPAPVTVRALAKLTLSLRISGVRPDGFHEIDAEMVTLDLCDELTFSTGDDLDVVGATGLSVTDGDDKNVWMVGLIPAAVGVALLLSSALIRPIGPGNPPQSGV